MVNVVEGDRNEQYNVCWDIERVELLYESRQLLVKNAGHYVDVIYFTSGMTTVIRSPVFRAMSTI